MSRPRSIGLLLTLALAAGSKDAAASIQRRLEFYRKRQPWRESFRKD